MLQLHLLSESKLFLKKKESGYSGNAAYVLNELFKNVNHHVFVKIEQAV